MWAGTMVGVVLSQEGVGHALPSSNMLDDLAFGVVGVWCGIGWGWCGVDVGVVWRLCSGSVGWC